jgi:predicted transcriptional regulator YdeE
MFDPQITGVDFMNEMGFETIVIPKQTYAIFETQKKKNPICDYADIRKKIVTEWLPTQDHVLANGPEIVILHWRVKQKKEWVQHRYIEICLPIEKK